MTPSGASIPRDVPCIPPSRAPPPGQGLFPTRSAPAPTHRPLTLGRAPRHLTLPRRGSPLSLRRPCPPSRGGRGRDEGRHLRTRTGAPRLPLSTQAWRRERGPNLRTPQDPGVEREGPATCPSPQEGLRPVQHLGQRREGGAAAPSSTHAHSAGARLSGWGVRSDSGRKHRGAGGGARPPAAQSGGAASRSGVRSMVRARRRPCQHTCEGSAGAPGAYSKQALNSKARADRTRPTPPARSGAGW